MSTEGGVIQDLLLYYEQGGFVMPPLAVATLILWYCLGYRFLTLRRGSLHGPRRLVELYRRGKGHRPRGIIDTAASVGVQMARCHPDHVRAALDDSFAELRQDLKRGRTLVTSVVTAAPLAGLLGTVVGMIETFDSLADMALFTQTGGIAGGISQALFTTQMGLAVAVPGVVIGQILDRRQRVLSNELDQVADILCGDDEPTHSARQGAV